jgi:hypothetical protein
VCALLVLLGVPAAARAQTTALHYESQSGDPVGKGLTKTILPADATFSASSSVGMFYWAASTGTWYWLTSVSNYSYASAGARQWGSQAAGDIPLLKDFDGDGQVDLTVWRASTGVWYWLTSSSGYMASASRVWGSTANGDVPIGR